MDNGFPARLREDINNSIKRRHEFSMRKLYFCIALLGFGALKIPISPDKGLDLTALLYLVPLVAIAFDFHIVSEDFRVKRVGEFLWKEDSVACTAERLWENFVKEHDNKLAPFAFFIVTFILLLGAAIPLYETSKENIYYYIWLGVLPIIDFGLVCYSRHLRSRFKKRIVGVRARGLCGTL